MSDKQDFSPGTGLRRVGEKPSVVLEPELLEAVEEKVISIFTTAIRQELKFHSGPLPTPGDFKGYEVVLPGSTNRILEMAEREQANRHSFNMEMAAQAQ